MEKYIPLIIGCKSKKREKKSSYTYKVKVYVLLKKWLVIYKGYKVLSNFQIIVTTFLD